MTLHDSDYDLDDDFTYEIMQAARNEQMHKDYDSVEDMLSAGIDPSDIPELNRTTLERVVVPRVRQVYDESTECVTIEF